MLIAFDIGNTSIAIGLFDGERLAATWRIGTDERRHPDEYGVLLTGLLDTAGIDRSQIKASIVACDVPPLTPTFESACRRYFGSPPMVVGSGLKTGIRILYDNPRDVGADRIVDAVAATKLYGVPHVVVDFGTATVFDAVNKDGDYLGGALAPGIMIAAEALYARAAKLYRVQLERPKSAIGKNTVAAMQSGILFGYVGLVEGLVKRFKEELGGEATVIGTGGWAKVVSRETDVIDVIDEDLTLTGLRLLYEMNAQG